MQTRNGIATNPGNFTGEEKLPLRRGLHLRDLQIFDRVLTVLLNAPEDCEEIAARVQGDLLSTARLKGTVRVLIEQFQEAEQGLFPPSKNRTAFREFLERALAGDKDFLEVARAASFEPSLCEIRSTVHGIEAGRLEAADMTVVKGLRELLEKAA